MRSAVVYHAFAVQISRYFADTFISQSIKIHIAGNGNFTRRYFFISGIGSLFHSFADTVKLAIHVTVASYFTGIEHAERSHRLKAFIRFGGIQSIAATAANTEYAHSVLIHARISGDEIRHAVNVFRAVVRFIRMARLTFTCSLICRVRRYRNVAELRQTLCIQAGYLFLNTAVRVRHYDYRIFFIHIITRRCIYIGRYF